MMRKQAQCIVWNFFFLLEMMVKSGIFTRDNQLNLDHLQSSPPPSAKRLSSLKVSQLFVNFKFFLRISHMC